MRVLRDFRGLPHDSLASRTFSREKHLENFFKICVLSVLVTCTRLDLGAIIVCFAQIGQFLNVFSFSLELFSIFIVFLISSLSQTHCALNTNLHCWSSLQPHSLRKRYGFLFSHSILHVYKCISSFCEILLSLCVLQCLTMGLLKMLGLVVWGWLFLLLDC